MKDDTPPGGPTGAGTDGAAAGERADAAAPDGTLAYAREMGVDHRDFFRMLPRAMGDHPYEASERAVDARVGGGTLRIELGEERVRRIALLALPFTEVSFTFRDTSEAEREAFTRRFELAFRRGGG